MLISGSHAQRGRKMRHSVSRLRANALRKNARRAAANSAGGIAPPGIRIFAKQLRETPEGKVAAGYLEDRGLDDAACQRNSAWAMRLAPETRSSRTCSGRFAEKLLDSSGLFSRESSGRLYDRFRRRVIFPIANESGKVIAFGARALGDDLPKYLNSPETPSTSKSQILYHLHSRARSHPANGFAILVEGYMDAIGVAHAGFPNVVASCGTSLAEPQVRLLARFTQRVVVNYDPDLAGRAATERSIALLLEKDFDVRVLALPGGADPDQFIREQGREAYEKLVAAALAYIEYLIGRARQMNISSVEGKVAALNFLMPLRSAAAQPHRSLGMGLSDCQRTSD